MSRRFANSGLITNAACFAGAFSWLMMPATGCAQSTPLPVASPEPTAAYAKAEAFLRFNAERMVLHAPDAVHWLTNHTLWYTERVAGGGRSFVIADTQTGITAPAFDHDQVARQLAQLTHCPVQAGDLPFFDLHATGDSDFSVQIEHPCQSANAVQWYSISRRNSSVAISARPLEYRADTAVSPDGSKAFRVHDFNLFALDPATLAERQITTDGGYDFYHAARADLLPSDVMPRWWGAAPDAITGVWSPNSRWFFSYQADIRAVPKAYVTVTGDVRPKQRAYPDPLAGDPSTPKLLPYVVDATSGRRIPIALSPIAYLFNAEQQVRWSADGKKLYLLLSQRGEAVFDLYRVNPETGGATLIYTEHSPQFIHMAHNGWAVLADDRTLIWSTSKDNWTRLYRIDLKTGYSLGSITHGDWNVTSIDAIDERSGWIYAAGVGREAGVWPYAQQEYRVKLDGTRIERLTPQPLNHDVSFAPDHQHFAAIAGLYDQAPTLEIRAADGSQGPVLARADIHQLRAMGWRPPEPVSVRSADGRFTDYGLLYKPSGFDPARSYPLIDLIYPGPGNGPIRVWGFTTDASTNPQSIAELGFEVLLLQASGTPLRSRAFQLAWYGDLGNLGLADHVAAIHELATNHPEIDPTRVGIVGISAGGDASARAILTYPDTYRAAVSVAGSYDYRQVLNVWGERYQGLYRRNADGTDNYPAPTFTLAARLKGKILVGGGGLDDNVNPALVARMVEALNTAGRPYDLISIPGSNHWPFEHPAFLQKMWNFLVQNVALEKPALDYRITPGPWDGSEAP